MKRIMILKYCLLIYSSFITYFAFLQPYKKVEGIFTYKVELINPKNNTGIEISKSTLYVNDTLVRTELVSPSTGNQTIIKNLSLNKQYILINYENQMYAISQKISKDTNIRFKFSYKRKKKKIETISAKKVIITKIDTQEKITCYYIPEINPNYLSVYPGINGLLVQYTLDTEDGLVRYTLESFKEQKINADAFSFSKEYQRISMDTFLEKVNKK